MKDLRYRFLSNAPSIRSGVFGLYGNVEPVFLKIYVYI